ncbi:MAG: sodium:solute symporter [Thermoanaerobaculia bacterium]|nr:sodium:solute symporter [Thermoanaerobaculia bacterium]
MNSFASLDWILIALYFLAIFAVAWFVAGRKKSTHESSAGYFLAGRNVGWFVIGTALFASNIGSEHLVGLAGTGFDSGVAVGQFEVLASLILLILGWLFVPFYIKSGVYTMPEFLEKRYSPAARWYLAVISIVGYVLTKISVTLYAGGIVYEVLLGGNFWTGALIIVVATGLYTVLGGLRAVLYTEMLQTILLIGGAILVTGIGMAKLGGWGAMVELMDESYFDMWQPMSHPSFPWTGILFGAPILGIWYWCTDQFIVQRVLSANGIDDARRGTIFGGYLKILPLFIFVVPGIVAAALVKTGQLELARADHALPEMIRVLLPVGLRGLVMAGFLAALMSSLAAVFNSCSTLITWDVYRKMRPNASEKQLVMVGKVSTLVLVGLGLLWIPFMEYISGQLYVYLQSVQAYISPPIAAVFLLGVFWRRVNGHGAIASLATGFVLGAARLVLELTKGSTDGLLYWYADINFLHFAILLFAICTVVLVAVSLLTPAQSDEQLAGLTFATASAGAEKLDVGLESDPAWKRRDLWLSILLAICVGIVWLYFRG